MLRAHTLHPAVLTSLGRLAISAEVTLWLVWHHRDPPSVLDETIAPMVGWAHAVALLGSLRPAPALAVDQVAELHGRVRADAQREARAWMIEPLPSNGAMPSRGARSAQCCSV